MFRRYDKIVAINNWKKSLLHANIERLKELIMHYKLKMSKLLNNISIPTTKWWPACNWFNLFNSVDVQFNPSLNLYIENDVYTMVCCLYPQNILLFVRFVSIYVLYITLNHLQYNIYLKIKIKKRITNYTTTIFI